MKSIQTILTIILVVLMVGMMPNLADAGGKTKTITISLGQFVPETTEGKYKMTPEYLTCTDSGVGDYWCSFYATLNLKKAKEITEISLFYNAPGDGYTSLTLYRCKKGEQALQMAFVSGSDATDWNEVVEVVQDLINYSVVRKGYTYYLRLYISNWPDIIKVYSLTVTYKTK